MYFYGFYQFLKGFWKFLKIGQFLAEKRSFRAFLHRFFLQWPLSQNLQNLQNNFDHSGPNKLKFGLGSLWGSFKKIIIKFFIFSIFWGLKNAKSAKIANKLRFSDFTGPKNCEKLKYQKSVQNFIPTIPESICIEF